MTTKVRFDSRAEQQAKAEKFCNGGYASGGRLKNEDAPAKDKRMVNKTIAKDGLKHGGEVTGEKPAARADKRARGGPMPEKAKGHGAPKGKKSEGGGKVNVNIISPAAGEDEKKQAAMAGLQAGARIGAAQAAKGMGGGKPPMAPPPPGAGGGAPGGAPPPGAMPPPGGMPPGQPPMKRGGRAEKC